VTGSREERPPYRVASLDGLDRVPLQEGVWRPVRRALGATAFGVNAYSADEVGAPLIEEHDERSPGAGGHEELYVVLRGAAEFTVGGDPVHAPAGTMVLVEPAVMRSAVATEAGTTVLVVGGRPGAALPPSPFEYWYAAIPAHEAGDHERALAIVTEGLEHHPDHGTIHYAIACELALLGRRSDALEHLRTAFANDPRTRGWAAEEPDLDSLRNDPLLSGR
jgi:mannose-6-phosphate isomerase-like protein (cupin superfamily)